MNTKMKMTLDDNNRNFYTTGSLSFCSKGLHDYFNFPLQTQEIDLRITKHQPKDGQAIKCRVALDCWYGATKYKQLDIYHESTDSWRGVMYLPQSVVDQLHGLKTFYVRLFY